MGHNNSLPAYLHNHKRDKLHFRLEIFMAKLIQLHKWACF